MMIKATAQPESPLLPLDSDLTEGVTDPAEELLERVEGPLTA